MTPATSGTSAAVHACLTEIEKAGARAAGLVRRILTFSRRQEPVKKVVELAPVIVEALALLRVALPANIAIRTEFADALPPVAIDTTQMHQIVMNLGTNAAHAMADSGGELLVSLDALCLDERLREDEGLLELAEGRYVRLTFKDSGHGMDRATRERVFEPFFTTHPMSGGTGLGLSVVHGIVKSHEGAITVQSEPQKGTTFQIFLPQATPSEGHDQAPAQAAEPGQGEHLLYVDDDEALVFLATRVLTRSGYQVTGCIDPMQALEMFRANPRRYDAVVTDLSMPRMSGSELAREMQRARPDVPIILTSGFIPPADKLREEFSGITAIILKPDTVDELAKVLRQTLAGAKRRS